MVDTSEIKQSVQREVEALVKARDEIKLQLQMVKDEARDELARLESRFERFQGEFKRIGNDAREPLREIGLAAKSLLGELTRGVQRARSGGKDMAD